MCVCFCLNYFNISEAKYSHLRKLSFAPRLAGGERDKGWASDTLCPTQKQQCNRREHVLFCYLNGINLWNSQLLPSSVNRLVSFTERKNIIMLVQTTQDESLEMDPFNIMDKVCVCVCVWCFLIIDKVNCVCACVYVVCVCLHV